MTGAGGFVGARLAAEILRRGEIGGHRVAGLALVDRQVPAMADPIVTAVAGDLGDASVMNQVRAYAPDVLFHLASVPGGAAEGDYLLGRRVNLDATVALFEAVAGVSGGGQSRPQIVVFVSTIAVYGAQLPPRVTPATPLHPPLTNGAHKLVGEILLADFARRAGSTGVRCACPASSRGRVRPAGWRRPS